jgi:hypothetical protein
LIPFEVRVPLDSFNKLASCLQRARGYIHENFSKEKVKAVWGKEKAVWEERSIFFPFFSPLSWENDHR